MSSSWNENDRMRQHEDRLLQTRRDVYLDAALVVEEAVGALFRCGHGLRFTS